MSIAAPGRRRMRDVPLRFVRRRFDGARERPVTASLSLTSMIDFLVVTVVFLLISFSPSQAAATNRGVHLPPAGNTLDMIDAPIVTIAASRILVDGSVAGNTRSIEEHRQMARLEELASVLSAKRDTWKQLHPDRVFPGVVLLQIDQDVSSVVVKSVFQTAAHAGYPSISFMVEHAPAH